MQAAATNLGVTGRQPAGSFPQPNAFNSLRAAAPDRVRAFWRGIEHLPAGATITVERVRDVVILSGWACEQRFLPDGRRQIFSFLLPGDPVEIRPVTDRDGRSVLTLTRLELAGAEGLAAAAGADRVCYDLQEARRARADRLLDSMVRIGRMTAPERMAHLLLELHDRLDAVGLVKAGSFRLPVTQEVFADALGLSLVHINRTVQQLRRDGCIQLQSGVVTLPDLDRLTAIAAYEPRWSGEVRAANA